jgi:hypothetical protein
MKLFDTPLEPPRLQRNSDDFAVVRQIAESGNDHPVLMLNMNRCTLDSGFPDHGAYRDYITGLGSFLQGAGGSLSSARRWVIRRSTRSSPAGTRSIGTSWNSIRRPERSRISAARACASNTRSSIGVPAIVHPLHRDADALLPTCNGA